MTDPSLVVTELTSFSSLASDPDLELADLNVTINWDRTQGRYAHNKNNKTVRKQLFNVQLNGQLLVKETCSLLTTISA